MTTSTVSEKTRISLPIPMLITVISAIVAALGSYVATAADVKRLDTQVAPVQQEQKVQDLRLQRLEDNYEHIRSSLDEIKADVRGRR